MVQDGRGGRRQENLRLSHRSRSSIQSGGRRGREEGYTVGEAPDTRDRKTIEMEMRAEAQRVVESRRRAQAQRAAENQRREEEQRMAEEQYAVENRRRAETQSAAENPRRAQAPRMAENQQREKARRMASGQQKAVAQHVQEAQNSGEYQGRRGSSEARWARWEETKYRRQKNEEKERQRKQKKIVGISLGAAAAVLLVAVTLWMAFGRKKPESTPAAASQGAAETTENAQRTLSDADFSFTVPADKQEAGTAQVKKEIADYEGYAVRYPVVGNEAVDMAIAKRVDDMASVFKTQVQTLRSDGRTRMTMATDYESYQTGDTLVSVKFNIHKELPKEDESGDSIETYTYRLSDGAEIALSDVFTEGYLEFLAGKTTEFAGTQTGVMKVGATEAVDTNFRYYTWNEDGLTLYFPGGMLMEGTSETFSFTIPMEELAPYLAMDLTGDGQTAQGPVSGKVDPTKPMVCLTFDDGPKAATTPELLDILEANDARATFFVVGSALEGNGAEDIIRRELELGCQVGNHTAEHKNFKEISDEEIESQIEGVNDIMKSWGFPICSTVRPPYGGWNNHVIGQVKYPMARWNVDTEDWKTKDPAATIQCVLYDEKLQAADGDIILMHDIHPETIEACKTIIPELKARGFQLVTMEEMFAAKGIPYEAGKVYYSIGDIRTDFGS